MAGQSENSYDARETLDDVDWSDNDARETLDDVDWSDNDALTAFMDSVVSNTFEYDRRLSGDHNLFEPEDLWTIDPNPVDFGRYPLVLLNDPDKGASNEPCQTEDQSCGSRNRSYHFSGNTVASQVNSRPTTLSFQPNISTNSAQTVRTMAGLARIPPTAFHAHDPPYSAATLSPSTTALPQGGCLRLVQHALPLQEDHTSIPPGVPASGSPWHEQQHHQCQTPGCGVSFTEQRSLKRHMREQHSNSRPFPCHVSSCEWHTTSFKRNASLKKHVKRKHPTQA